MTLAEKAPESQLWLPLMLIVPGPLAVRMRIEFKRHTRTVLTAHSLIERPAYLSATVILRPSADTSISIFWPPSVPSNSYFVTLPLAEWLASM